MITLANVLATFVAGLASFVAPCTVPLLPAYLATVSGVSAADLAGALLLIAYSLGLGLPFLLAALAWASLPGLPRRITRLARPLTVAGGLMTIALGVLLASGAYTHLTSYLAQISTPR